MTAKKGTVKESARSRELETVQRLNVLSQTADLYQERIAELELALEDRSYIRLAMEGNREFSRDGLQRIVDVCRMMFLKNPLIKRAVRLQRLYVFSRGFEWKAKNDDVKDVLTAFWDDAKNRVALTSHGAINRREEDLQETGNLFFAFFTNESTGMVRVRAVLFDEIADIITDPDDRDTVWFYKRQYLFYQFDPVTGVQNGVQRTAYHPDWQYVDFATDRPTTIGGSPVMWDQPIMHVATNRLASMRFGVPEIYAALDWARAVKDDLEDYATVKRALARYAWNVMVKGGSAQVAAAKAKLTSTIGERGMPGLDLNPPPLAGSTFIASEGGAKIDPVRTGGAQASPDEGRVLRLMVGAATDTPETMLMGDADVGNLATAKTLDRPTEMKIVERQQMWKNVLQDVFMFVIKAAINAENNPLVGKITTDTDFGTQEIEVDGDPDNLRVDIYFPAVLEHDVGERVQAIVTAATLDGKRPIGTMSDRTLVKELMSALDIEDIDSRLDELFPDGDSTEPTGNFEPPPEPALPGEPAPGETTAATAARNGR